MGKDGAEVGEVRVGAWRGEGGGLGERGEGGLACTSHGTTMEQLWNNYGTTHGTTHGTTTTPWKTHTLALWNKEIIDLFFLKDMQHRTFFLKS